MHEQYFKEAGEVAAHATCHQARCGSVIVSQDNVVIGRGCNAPPLGDEAQRKCDEIYHSDKKPNSDKTCCVHAEWNAIIDALQNYGDKIVGSTLYFMRIADDNSFTQAGKPYCTVCSRLALQSGITTFGLWNDGPDMIDAKEYNLKSYSYYS